jgi:hypothetical protein
VVELDGLAAVLAEDADCRSGHWHGGSIESYVARGRTIAAGMQSAY